MDIRKRTELAIDSLTNWYTKRYRKNILNQFFKRVGEKETYSDEDFVRFLAWAKEHYSKRSFKTVSQCIRWFCRVVLNKDPDRMAPWQKEKRFSEVPDEVMKIPDIRKRTDMAISYIQNGYRRRYIKSIINQFFKIAGEKQTYTNSDLRHFLEWAEQHYAEISYRNVLYCMRWFWKNVLRKELEKSLLTFQTPVK